MRNKILFSLLTSGLLFFSTANAEESAATPAPVTSDTTSTAPPPAPTATTTPVRQPKLIGPTGATGVIRRSDRRQDRRLEEDLEDLGDAIDRKPRARR